MQPSFHGCIDASGGFDGFLERDRGLFDLQAKENSHGP